MSLKFIRQQTISSIIRLRSNSKRTDLTLFCEQDENASMPVVTLMASRCYRFRHERVHRHSPTGGAATSRAQTARPLRIGASTVVEQAD
jgi:hypothetical protein